MAGQVKLFVILSSITGTHVVERKNQLLQAGPHMNSVAHPPPNIYKIKNVKTKKCPHWEPCSPCSLPLQALPAHTGSPRSPRAPPFHPLHTWACLRVRQEKLQPSQFPDPSTQLRIRNPGSSNLCNSTNGIYC